MLMSSEAEESKRTDLLTCAVHQEEKMAVKMLLSRRTKTSRWKGKEGKGSALVQEGGDTHLLKYDTSDWPSETPSGPGTHQEKRALPASRGPVASTPCCTPVAMLAWSFSLLPSGNSEECMSLG
ncbi:SOSS complex subunit C isoform X1 [Nycticebus coucang]|uniref:SOSS complex subunit C isoform X1 n=1 Tax=Nycticebus coucang TaxID=9470 RepID=UPI00234E0297|nr:SOSS complex subunit C isoform X1 [Nycticebus coucang]